MAYYNRYRKSYTRGAYAPAMTKKVALPQFAFNSVDAWSAAAAATRVNGSYLKETSYRYDEATNTQVIEKEANKIVVKRMLENGVGWTEEDSKRGAAARDYWQSALLKLMTNTANDFEQTAVRVANSERIENNYDLAVLSSLVVSAERGMARDVLNDMKSNLPSKFQGTVGKHVILTNAEVLTTRYNSDFGKYRVDVKCEGNLYNWWSSKEYKPGDWVSVKGKVKQHYNDRATNSEVTQLNYVKEV